MRMAKKAVAIALTAVMALSMLTACGGGGSSSGGNNNNGAGNGGNNNSSNVGGDTNGGGANSGSNSGSNSGTSTGGTGSETKPTSTTLKNSRTGALAQKAMSSGQIQIVVVGYNETFKEDIQMTLAMSGKNGYMQTANKDGSKVYYEEIGNGTERKAYLVLYPDSPQYKSLKKRIEDNGYNTEKLTMPIYIEDEEEYDPDDFDISIGFGDYAENEKVELGTYTYKKTKQTYDAEKLTDKDGDQTIYCYDKSNTRRLIVEFDKDSETGVVKEMVSEVKSIAFTVNQTIFKVNKDAIDYREMDNYVTKK